MQLIPESWFIKRSAFTGQETVFPREKILGRVTRIQDLKDRYSLEELAELLSPDWGTKRYEPQVLSRLGLPARLPDWLRHLRTGDTGRRGSAADGATAATAVSVKFSDLVALVLDRDLQADSASRSAREAAVRAVATGLEHVPDLSEREEIRVVVVSVGRDPDRTIGIVANGEATLHFFPQVDVRVDRSLIPIIEKVRDRLQGWTD